MSTGKSCPLQPEVFPPLIKELIIAWSFGAEGKTSDGEQEAKLQNSRCTENITLLFWSLFSDLLMIWMLIMILFIYS